MITQERANEVYRECLRVSVGFPWSDSLRRVMAPEEYEAVRRVWIDQMPGSSSFADTLLAIANGHIQPRETNSVA